MMKTFRLALIALTVLTGCAQRYKITLTNLNVITTRSRPKLDPATSVYRFKNAQGKPMTLPEFKIKEIEPL